MAFILLFPNSPLNTSTYFHFSILVFNKRVLLGYWNWLEHNKSWQSLVVEYVTLNKYSTLLPVKTHVFYWYLELKTLLEKGTNSETGKKNVNPSKTICGCHKNDLPIWFGTSINCFSLCLCSRQTGYWLLIKQWLLSFQEPQHIGKCRVH